jgi:hypothetical protein
VDAGRDEQRARRTVPIDVQRGDADGVGWTPVQRREVDAHTHLIATWHAPGSHMESQRAVGAR